MPNYKLTYFNFKGRGEILRYIFAYKNTPYEDNRIEYSEWPAHKACKYEYIAEIVFYHAFIFIMYMYNGSSSNLE